MSRLIGDRLTDALLSRLGRARALAFADRAIVICTVDEHGWPHPAMVSSLELIARDPRNLRCALHAGSRSARNIHANGRLTIVLAEETMVCYVKGSARSITSAMNANRDLALFHLRVESVLEDTAAEYEDARLISGIRVARAVDQLAAAALLDELLAAPTPQGA